MDTNTFEIERARATYWRAKCELLESRKDPQTSDKSGDHQIFAAKVRAFEDAKAELERLGAAP